MRKPEKGACVSGATVPSHDVCPAKTFVRPDGRAVLGRTVLNHCEIVGNVADEIVSRYPPAIKRSLFPQHVHLAAALHDIGKVSPYFVEKLRRSCGANIEGYAPNLGLNPMLESTWGGHAGVSQVCAEAMKAPRWIPEILGQHHGYSPAVAGLSASAEKFGGKTWQAEREALVHELKMRLDANWPQLKSIAMARVVAGLTSVSDWIGSGKFFEDPELPWEPSIKQAVDDAGFIAPTYIQNLVFEQVFPFNPNALQKSAMEQIEGPGVYVIEAPMGLGKTEAALYAAYRVLVQGQACGIYFALPTQLTSNKIFERFNQFLEAIVMPVCKHRSWLLHANAWLVDTDMGEDGRPGGAWFNQRKRGLLAPFAVGTIDQALMAAMHVKHGFVRTFGLAGKVVILDEVHSYDAYTSTLLDALVELLRQLHCTVIILSATLNRSRRGQLTACLPRKDDYPLITASGPNQAPQETAVPATAGNRIAIKREYSDDNAIDSALACAEQGQQVLWIENTVKEAQSLYRVLAARGRELGIECGLIHSRFTMDDRQTIEDNWVNAFGKAGWARRAERGRILVGTQVLEQSLDIDADFLVSRFAPSDMLLQRLGRLWRHAETPRPANARCAACMLIPDRDAGIESPLEAFGATAWVYSPYVLCRSLDVWHQTNEVSLPDDVRHIIDSTYEERAETGAMARWLHELEEGSRCRRGRKSLAHLARVGLSSAGKTLPESKAETRYSDQRSCDVLLLGGIRIDKEARATRLQALDGSKAQLPWGRQVLSREKWRQLSAWLMRQMVNVPENEAPDAATIDNLKKLGLDNALYLGNPADHESVLRLAIVNNLGVLTSLHGQAASREKNLSYDSDMGYQVIKNKAGQA